MRRSRRGRRRALSLGFLVATAAGFLISIPALGGDAVLARYLLDGARSDIGQKKYDEALGKLEKAAAEDPTLVEVRYWVGVASERAGRDALALEAYRAFLAALRGGGGPPSEELLALRKQAQTRVEALAPGEVELRKCEEAFVSSLLAYAKANLARDRGLASRALDHLLAVRPDHEEARRLLRTLAPAPAAADAQSAAAGGPFQTVRKWRELRTPSAFASPPGWKFEKDRLVMEEQRGGAINLTYDDLAPPGHDFAYECEVRLLAERGPYPFVGLVVGSREKGTNLVSVMLMAGKTVVHRRRPGQVIDLRRVEHEPIDLREWHRFGLVVKGRNVAVWLDGRRLYDIDVEDRENLAGAVGVHQQDSKAELRLLRLGTF